MAQAGDILAGWVLIEKLGNGSMGTVYRAHRKGDPSDLGALKTLVEDEQVPDAAKRFAREAQLLASLDHPGVTRFIAASDDPPVIVMEFVQGQSLDLRLAAGPLPVEQAVHLVRQMCDALTYLHARQIWHRDVKPANIIIEPAGWTRLVDFGIAVAKDSTRYTRTGTLMGSLAYVPPEAIEGEPDPTLWDVYSLGVVFCEALTGAPPFGSSGQIGPLIAAKQTRRFLDPGPGFPDEVRALVRHMTAAAPQDRLQSAAAVSRRARALVGGQGPLIDAGIAPVALAAHQGVDEVPVGRNHTDSSTLTAPIGGHDDRTTRLPAPEITHTSFSRKTPLPKPTKGFGAGTLLLTASLASLLTLVLLGLPTAGWLALGGFDEPPPPPRVADPPVTAAALPERPSPPPPTPPPTMTLERAQTACASAGGLASVEQAPERWAEADGPIAEWRQGPEGAVWRFRDGAVFTDPPADPGGVPLGVRCAE